MESSSNLLDGLNDQQRQAATHIHGPLLVLAGAGTGKTRVITTRIANLLTRGVAPENILAVSFTRRAGAEMKTRLLERVGELAQKTHVSTFHALGLSIIREQCSAAGLNRNFRVCNAQEQLGICEQVVDHLEPRLCQDSELLDMDPAELLRTISSAKARGAGNWQGTMDDHQRFVDEAVSAYDDLMRQSNCIDLDDMLAIPQRILASHKDIRARYRARFQYLMVDEYQDTNSLQVCLLRSLLGPHHNLCVVGDDDQSIYAFRGANRDLILNFPRQFPAAKVVTLTTNYRCSRQIVNVANTVMQASTCRYEKKLTSANGPHAAVRCVDVLDEESELQFIVDELRDARHPPSHVAILCRRGKDVNAAKRVLSDHEIPLGRKLHGVNVMTLHASKGLEFPVVYLTGVQEDILPNWNAIKAGPEAVEEERRLFYVGVTRAERQLTFTAAQYRGEYISERSRFADELLAENVVEHHELAVPS